MVLKSIESPCPGRGNFVMFLLWTIVRLISRYKFGRILWHFGLPQIILWNRQYWPGMTMSRIYRRYYSDHCATGMSFKKSESSCTCKLNDTIYYRQADKLNVRYKVIMQCNIATIINRHARISVNRFARDIAKEIF